MSGLYPAQAQLGPLNMEENRTDGYKRDLIWYLSDRNWPAPNLTLLNQALAQTDWSGPDLILENRREVVRRRLETVSFERASLDVRPFPMSDEDIKLVSRENLLGLLG